MKTKALLAILLVGAAWASVATATKPYQTRTVCHRGKTLQVSKHAVYAHMGHGDLYGPCRGDIEPASNTSVDAVRRPCPAQ